MRITERIAATAFVVAVLFCSMDIGVAHADFVPGELIVVFDDEVLPALTFGEGIESAYEGLGDLFTTYELVDAIPLFSEGCPLQNVYLLRFPEEAELDTITEDLGELTFVLSVDKNEIYEVCSTPNDYYFNHDINGSGELDQWTFYKMQVNRAWDVTRGDSTQITAVIDTGFDWHHPDLDQGVAWINADEDINHSGAFENWSSLSGGDLNGVEDNGDGGPVDDVMGFDFFGNDPDPAPDLAEAGDHGTKMSSIIRAETNNSLGVAGITWFTKLMPLRVGAGMNVIPSKIVSAINYAVKNGAKVVNMSFVGGFDAAIHAAIQKGDSLGVIFVAGAAAGNSESTTYYPGNYPEVIRVTSVDSLGYKTTDANYGTTVDISAPTSQDSYNEDGIAVCTYFYGQPNVYPGDSSPHVFRFTQLATSGAAAEVSGVVALLRAAYPDSSNDFIKQELYRGAMPLADPLYGYGKLGAGAVNAYRSLTRWGTVTSDTTWGSASQPTTVYVSGDITVAVGATLTIEPGTTIKIARQDNEHLGVDDDLIEINVEGELVADGTEANPIVFEPWISSAAGDWVGFSFDSTGSGGTFDHCVIKKAEIAVLTYAPLTMTHTEIDSCATAGVISGNGDLLVENCQLKEPGYIGISVAADDAVVRDTKIDGALAFGLSTYAGLYPSLDVHGSWIMNCDTGLNVSGNVPVDVDSACFFYQNDTGIHFYNAGTGSTVRTAGITWNTSNGVLCDASSSPRIVSCILAHNGSAIYCSNSSSPRIQANQIQSAGNAITATSSAGPNVGYGPSCGSNKIAHTGGKYVANYTGSTIYARHNGWDLTTSPCTPLSSKFLGSVAYDSTTCPCSFPLFTHNEGEPDFGESFVFQLPQSAPAPKRMLVTTLMGIVPNPFNPQTTIHYSLASQGRVEIKIYDVAGRLIQTLANETQIAGEHSIVWKGTDRRGSSVASGIYFVRLNAAGQVFTRKMVLLK